MPRDRRGEVWLVDLGYAAKTRPALVVSVPALDTERALVLLVPHTTSPRVRDLKFYRENAFSKPAFSMPKI
jgi:mRNA-degrading endonuclease toxin of MazEF toxin-antitoxin module